MADDFSEKLNAILGDPQAMGQILSLAQSLGGGQGAEPSGEPPPQEGPPPPPDGTPAQEAHPAAPDLSGLSGLLGGLAGGGEPPLRPGEPGPQAPPGGDAPALGAGGWG